MRQHALPRDRSFAPCGWRNSATSLRANWAAITIGNLLLSQLNNRSGAAPESAVGRRILIHRMHTLALMLSEQLSESLMHYDYVVEHYRADRHAVLRFAYGSDQLALTYAHQAWLHTIAGRNAEAETAARLARNASDWVAHLHTMAQVISVLASSTWSAGAHAEAVLYAQEARTTAIENGFQYWAPWADVVLAADAARTTPRTGYKMLEQAMTTYRATGALKLCPFIHYLLSTAAFDDRQYDIAVKQADAGLAMLHQNGCALYSPELHRRRTLALFAIGDQDTAAISLETGYEEACRFGAGLFAHAIELDGIMHSRGRQQIIWQTRYHAEVTSTAARNEGASHACAPTTPAHYSQRYGI
jgi:hypothetical protein